ncbi:MAG: FHA domain-containing protein [Thermodesulfobacteriota bacterium]|nr:FHA domain-containing protein [Thermodesulfobacteriota bacterium]
MSARFSIVIVKGPSVGETYSFDQSIVSIGRTAAENDLVLNDRSITGKHARITVERGRVYLQDLKSTNGTYYNGAALQIGEKVRLEHRDEFSLGKVVLEYLELKDAETDSADRDVAPDGIPTPKDKDKKVAGKGVMSLLQRKAVRISLIIFIIFFAVILGLKIFSEPEIIVGPPNLSKKPLFLPAPDVYGYTKSIPTRPHMAIFKFTAKSERIDLLYEVGGVDYDGEISIILNGSKIANAPLAIKSWSDEQVLHLPRKLLVKNGENTLVFKHTKNPPAKEKWAVRNLRIEFLTPEKCNEDEGKRLFSMGEELFNEKTVSDVNIYLACQYFKEAVAFSEECRPRPDFLMKAEKQLAKAQKELESRYKDLMFAYKKSLRLKNYFKTKEVLEEILRLIPDKKNLRHIDAKDILNRLNQALREAK